MPRLDNVGRGGGGFDILSPDFEPIRIEYGYTGGVQMKYSHSGSTGQPTMIDLCGSLS